MPVKRPTDVPLHERRITVRARPIGLAERYYVENAISDLVPEWSVDLHGVCIEDASLILLPAGGDDAMGPSFVISRETLGFKVDQLHWDLMQEIGTFPELAEAVAAVRFRLANGSSRSLSLTVH